MALSTGGRRDHPALLGDIWSLCMKYLQYHDRDLVSCCQVSREVRAASQIYLYREIVVGTENRAAGLLEAIEVDDRIAMLIKKLHVHTVYYESVRDGDVWDNRVVTWAHESTTLPTLIPKLTQVTWLHVVLDSENSLHHNLLGQHLSKLPAIRSLDVAERGSSRFDLPDALAVFVNHFTGLHKLALESEVTSNRMIDHVDRLSATGVLASEPEELSVKLPEDRYTLEWLLQKLPPLKTLRLYDPDQMTSELYQAAAEKSKETLHELYFCTESSHDNPCMSAITNSTTGHDISSSNSTNPCAGQCHDKMSYLKQDFPPILDGLWGRYARSHPFSIFSS